MAIILPDQISEEDQVQSIALILLSNRKVSPKSSCDGGVDCKQCVHSLMGKIRHFVHQQAAVEMVVPGFPFKMPSLLKTFGVPLPDKAEELSLAHLMKVAHQIQLVYAPGAKIILASDGRIIVPVWQTWWPTLSLEGIALYDAELDNMLMQMGACSCIKLFRTLDVAYPNLDYMKQLGHFYADNVKPLQLVRESSKVEGSATEIAFKGNFGYFFHDSKASPITIGMSTEKIKERSAEAAYRAVQNSDALTELLRKLLPDAIRLSVHPQPAHSHKLGFHMLPSQEQWRTPWHCIALLEQETGTWKFPEYAQAIEVGAEVVSIRGRPYYCVLKSGIFNPV